MTGKTISHYKILEKLGEGGMGVVYKAEDTKLKRTVALKFLPEGALGDGDEKTRFIHEAQAAAALNHPNISTIYEIDESEGQTFIAMECVEGTSLKDKITSGPLGPAEAVDIAAQVAHGLREAHAKGIVHRDIKPANIMVTSGGRAKIMDFGLAKTRGRARLTRTGSTLGTVAYMSPEQLQGEDVDGRSDVWSLGVVIYEMMTETLPFTGDYEPAVVYSILNHTPQHMGSLRTGVPGELERIVAKCLEKDRDKRYQRVDELLEDIGRAGMVASGGSRQVPTAGRAAGSRSWVRPVVWAALAIAVFCLGLVLSGRVFRPGDRGASTERKMVVVLPFENLGSPEDEYFADGVTEEITSRLAGVGGLGVISRTSAFKYKGAKKTVKEIGGDLGVDYVLEGTVRWERTGAGESRVRVTPQLIRVSDDIHLWSERYDRDLNNIFEVQSQIAERVIDKLNVTLMGPERQAVEGRPTANLEAYQAYLRGKDYSRGPDQGKENQELAEQMYERAVELDPGFAAAYAELSQVHSRMYNDFVDRTEGRLAKAKAAVDKALELQPGLPDAHLALAYYYYWGLREYDLALQELAVAAKGLPNDSRILRATGYIKRRSGDFETARESLMRALELDPQDAALAEEIGSTCRYLHVYAEAESYYDRAISLAPDMSSAYTSKAYNRCLWTGDTQEAREILQAAHGKTDPFAPLIRFLIDRYDRKYEDMLAILTAVPDEALESQFIYIPRSLVLGSVYNLMGKTELGAAWCDSASVLLEKEALERPDDERIHISLGFAYAAMGRKADAIREGKQAVELSRASNDALYYSWRMGDLASIYVIAGEYNAALDQIDYLLSNPSLLSVSVLKIDPIWDPLRGDPRFKRLLEKYLASN